MKDGLTPEERVVSDALYVAWYHFKELVEKDPHHYDEFRDFTDGIHQCQHQLMWRIIHRDYPEAWPIKSGEEE
jgi:hypothetical protein